MYQYQVYYITNDGCKSYKSIFAENSIDARNKIKLENDYFSLIRIVRHSNKKY